MTGDPIMPEEIDEIIDAEPVRAEPPSPRFDVSADPPPRVYAAESIEPAEPIALAEPAESIALAESIAPAEPVYEAELVGSAAAVFLGTAAAMVGPAAPSYPGTTVSPAFAVAVAGPVYAAEVVEACGRAPSRSWLGRMWDRVGSASEWLFGLASLFAGLAMLATFPIVQLLSLGYLLESSGRVARSGRLRDGFVGVRKAARVGSVLLGAWLTFWPLRLVADLAYSSWLIEPSGRAAVGWRTALVVLTGLTVWHLGWACFRGGRLRHFLWPAPVAFVRRLRRGGMYREARDRLAEFVASLRPGHYFSLGARGFAGAAAWLVLPVLLLIASFRLPDGPAALCGVLGLLTLPLVALYLPFLQAQFACENRLVAMFDVGRVRQAFQRAPIAFWFSLLVLLAFALPPFLLKIEFVEREIAGVESLVFVALIAPARLLAGWALGRGRHRVQPRFFLVRWLGRLGMLPLVIVYAVVVSLSRYTSWYGSWSLFEQHAFLLPAPFLGL
jgi:hypothetical protein